MVKFNIDIYSCLVAGYVILTEVKRLDNSVTSSRRKYHCSCNRQSIASLQFYGCIMDLYICITRQNPKNDSTIAIKARLGESLLQNEFAKGVLHIYATPTSPCEMHRAGY